MFKLIKISKNEDGLASIFISMIIMIVISLLLIGFVQYANNEQKQSFNRQLETEAFYAAESGVNQAENYVNSNYSSGFIYSSSQCDASNTSFSFLTHLSYGSVYANIPCIYINLNPNSIAFNNINIGDYRAFELSSSTGSNISSIKFFWQNSNLNSTSIASGTNCYPFPQLPQSLASDCAAGILRVDIVSSTDLTKTLSTLFIYPSTNSAVDINYTQQGLVAGNCNTSPMSGSNQPQYCEATVNVPTNPTYYLRIVPIYLPSNVTIQAFDSSGNQQNLSNGQVVVDSTGNAASTLQRIRVRMSLNNSSKQNYEPIDGLDSTEGICKHFQVPAGTLTDISSNNGPCPNL